MKKENRPSYELKYLFHSLVLSVLPLQRCWKNEQILKVVGNKKKVGQDVDRY